MKSMKQLLKSIGALALTTGAATSVVACGGVSPESVVDLNQKVAQDLDLLDNEGNGTQEASIKSSKWTIPVAENQVTAATLLDSDNKAKSEESYKFLTQTLNQKPIGEKSEGFEEDKFDKVALEKIKGIVSVIKPTLTAVTESSKNDFAVTAGTFRLQFKSENDKNLGGTYLIKLKVVADKGVVGSSIANIADNIAISDTDVTTSVLNFRVGAKFPKISDVKGKLVVKLVGESEVVKNYNALSELLNMKIEMVPTDFVVAGDETWNTGDTLEFSYKIDEVIFRQKTNFTLE